MKSSVVQEILDYNERFVADGGYKPFETDKFPTKKLAVLACMDVRLIELLPAALGLKNGDAHFVKVAGGGVSDPHDSAVRSLLVSVCELGTEDIMVIAHSECGAQHMDSDGMFAGLQRLGVAQEVIDECINGDFDYASWFAGFGELEGYVQKSVAILRDHPLMPAHVRISGYFIDSHTGALTKVA
ncbi:MAG: carbonic anhydrase [Coriobacteriaceae bacterium]|jgi:carbonic anhydrase|nr:carbonic anhydrase [Coriobacteriaceae bacterium]